MNWTSKHKQKFWNKAYKEYARESTIPIKDLINWIKINPFVAVAIENRAIQFLKEEQQ